MKLSFSPYGLRRTYTIRQLSNEFGVTSRALRFYEEKGLVTPDRYGMSRVYTEQQRHRLSLVISGRRLGLTVTDIARIFEQYDAGGSAAQDRKALELFEKRRIAVEAERQIVEAQLASLDAACARLRERITAAETPPAEQAA